MEQALGKRNKNLIIFRSHKGEFRNCKEMKDPP